MRPICASVRAGREGRRAEDGCPGRKEKQMRQRSLVIWVWADVSTRPSWPRASKSGAQQRPGSHGRGRPVQRHPGCPRAPDTAWRGARMPVLARVCRPSFERARPLRFSWRRSLLAAHPEWELRGCDTQATRIGPHQVGRGENRHGRLIARRPDGAVVMASLFHLGRCPGFREAQNVKLKFKLLFKPKPRRRVVILPRCTAVQMVKPWQTVTGRVLATKDRWLDSPPSYWQTSLSPGQESQDHSKQGCPAFAKQTMPLCRICGAFSHLSTASTLNASDRYSHQHLGHSRDSTRWLSERLDPPGCVGLTSSPRVTLVPEENGARSAEVWSKLR